jgi:hypothetical protein
MVPVLHFVGVITIFSIPSNDAFFFFAKAGNISSCHSGGPILLAYDSLLPNAEDVDLAVPIDRN